MDYFTKKNLLFDLKQELEMDVYYQIKDCGDRPAIVNPVYQHSDKTGRNYRTGFVNRVTVEDIDEDGNLLYDIWCFYKEDGQSRHETLYHKPAVKQDKVMFWLKQFYSAAAIIYRTLLPHTAQEILDSEVYEQRYGILKYTAEKEAAEEEAK